MEALPLVAGKCNALVQQRVADQVVPPLRYPHGFGLGRPGGSQVDVAHGRKLARPTRPLPLVVLADAADSYSGRPWTTSIPTTQPPRTPRRPGRRSKGMSGPTSVSWAPALPAARPRWISRPVVTAWCCSNRNGSAGEHRGAAAARRYSVSGRASRRSRSQVGLEDARRMWDVSVEALALLKAAGSETLDRLRPELGPAARRDEAAAARRVAATAAGTRRHLRISRARVSSSARTSSRCSRRTGTARGCTIQAAATCTRSTTRSGSRPPPRKPARASMNRPR